MYKQIQKLIYLVDIDEPDLNRLALSESIGKLAKQAFIHQDKTALLMAHRILYQLNMAHLAVSWQFPTNNIMHPIIVDIKYQLEKQWALSEKQQYHHLLQTLPDISHFPEWIQVQVSQHAANQHPLLQFLQVEATLEQMQTFFFQETPLEMLFGDIVAFMLPGVYGEVKIECLKNYWDEMGHAKDEQVHRNLRFYLVRAH